jgi:hypothetical protein
MMMSSETAAFITRKAREARSHRLNARQYHRSRKIHDTCFSEQDCLCLARRSEAQARSLEAAIRAYADFLIRQGGCE